MRQLIVFSLLTVFIGACFSRTPSKERFEKACEIKFPKKYQVIKDEYQDMGQDFALDYNLKLDAVSMTVLAKSIRQSKYYNDSVFSNDLLFSDSYFYPALEAVWIKSINGYIFRNKNKKHTFSAIVDTISFKAEFHESLD